MRNKLLGVIIVLGCLASISGCRTSKQGYVAKGNKLFDAGKYSEAVINYAKAIQKDERYGEAYYRVGLAEIKQGHSSAALDAFYRAVQLLPNDANAKEQLGSLSLQYYMYDPRRPQRYYDIVKKNAAELLQQNPQSFEGIREEAYLAMTDAKRDAAIALFRRAHSVNPSDPAVTTALIQNLLVIGQGGEAERLGLDLIAHQRSYGPIYDVMYAWYVKGNRPADAENIIKAKANSNPKEGSYQLELAAHYDGVHKPAEMQAALQHLLDNAKDFPQARLQVGDFYARIRNYPEAVRYFDEGARTSQGSEKVLYQKRAANALLAEGKGSQASSTVDQIVEQSPKDEEARRIQASMLLRTGDPKKIQAAEREFQELLKQAPNDAAVWLGLGRAEEFRGNLDQARARYLEALKRAPGYLQARYALAEISLIQKRPDETLRQAEEILKVRPNDPRARLLHAEALARTGNKSTARIELTRITDRSYSTQAQVELGLLALSEKNYHEAEEIFGKLRATGDPRAITGLAEVYTAQKYFDKALALLSDGLTKSSNSVPLLDQYATTAALAGQYDLAIAQFQKLIALEPNSVRTRLKLAETFTRKGDDSDALQTYAGAAKLAPKDLDTALGYADELSAAGRINDARTQYQAVLKAQPDNPRVLNDMAYFLAQNGGNLDQALGFAKRALAIAPGQPVFSDTIGCIYLKKGLNDSALQVFGNLAKKYPNYPTFRYHFGEALLTKGDKKGAKKELESALAAHPSQQDQARIKELLGKIG